jgi:hypothetical protein
LLFLLPLLMLLALALVLVLVLVLVPLLVLLVLVLLVLALVMVVLVLVMAVVTLFPRHSCCGQHLKLWMSPVLVGCRSSWYYCFHHSPHPPTLTSVSFPWRQLYRVRVLLQPCT